MAARKPKKAAKKKPAKRGRPRNRPSAEDRKMLEEQLERGSGLYRAAEILGYPRGAVNRWMARGQKDLVEGKTGTLEAKFASMALAKRSELIVKAEHIVKDRLDKDDEEMAKWLLERLVPKEYARKSVQEVVIRGKLEELLEELKLEVSSKAWAEVIGALRKIHERRGWT